MKPIVLKDWGDKKFATMKKNTTQSLFDSHENELGRILVVETISDFVGNGKLTAGYLGFRDTRDMRHWMHSAGTKLGGNI